MKKLILKENDLSTIVNALTGLASVCRKDADNAPPTAVGRYLAAAARESADQYGSLANQIASADSIKVET